MTSFVEVRRGAYRDSVTLMQVSKRVATADGIDAALVVMATPVNLELLAAEGFPPPADTGPNDLVIAIRAGSEGADEALAAARATLEHALTERPAPAGAAPDATGRPAPARTLGAAAARLAGASLALVSVPGRYAFVEAMDALEAGLDVVVFSDNVPVAEEVRLKEEGRRRGLLVMGPDCGTAVVSGVGLGFANRVRRGPVGLVAASGTGAQQLMCLLDAAGTGISHCLGVGGRDLSAAVGGRSARQALELLDADPGTELIVVVSKPPAAEVAAEIRDFAAKLATPAQFAFLGRGQPDLSAAAARALAAIGADTADAAVSAAGVDRADGPAWPHWIPDAAPPTPRAGALRGLFCGGTLCDEAMAIASGVLGPVASNIPLEPGWAVGDDLRHDGHLMIDFGDDRLTAGRPHPMIDPSLRLDRLAAELAGAAGPGPATPAGAVLIDVILGDGAHPDPAAELAPVVAGAPVPVVVSLIGAAADPQGLDRQAESLRQAGAAVFLSNAAAARFAVSLVRRDGGGAS